MGPPHKKDEKNQGNMPQPYVCFQTYDPYSISLLVLRMSPKLVYAILEPKGPHMRPQGSHKKHCVTTTITDFCRYRGTIHPHGSAHSLLLVLCDEVRYIPDNATNGNRGITSIELHGLAT